MLGYSKSSKLRSSDPLFSPISNETANAYASLPTILNDVVNQTIVRELQDLKKTVAQEYPELANSINFVNQNGKLMYVMDGVGASDAEYGNEDQAPRAYIRRAAERTSQNIQSAIQKVTRL